MSSGKVGSTLEWSFGLRNSAIKYLTAETYCHAINCSASIMKKKQIFFLEQNPGQEAVYIKSHLGKYLTVDGDGKFTCDGEGKGDEQAMIIEPQADGKWAIKSQKYGWYTGGTGENLTAFTKEISEDRLWTVHLAMHPQVNLKNVNRKSYVHLDDGSLSTDEIVPWGTDATITLHFFDDDGTYGIVACNGKYLSHTGALVDYDSNNVDTHFIIEFSENQVAFKSKKLGRYVTALGSKGTLKANKPSITKDELFIMEDSFPQISIKGKNGKYVSIKQGIELAATASHVTDNEIFQIEPLGSDNWDEKSGSWALKSSEPKYWFIDGSSVQANREDSSDPSSSFTIEWHGDKVALKACNGRYVEQLNNRNLHAKAAEKNESTYFTYEIVNRSSLVLRGEYGFIGTLPSELLECNKSVPVVYSMTIKDGKVSIADPTSGKYWKVGANGVSCSGDAPEEYTIEIYDNSKLAIKYNDKYFESAQNGAFTLTGTKLDRLTLFEY